MKHLFIFFCLLSTLTFALCHEANLVLKNGKIITMDDKQMKVQAIAVCKNKIVAVGSNKEIEKWIDSQTKVIDLNGKLVVPGFIETHGHLVDTGKLELVIDLDKAVNEKHAAQMVEKYAKKIPSGEWIMGQSWDQNNWTRKKFPEFYSITKAAPNNPVCLYRIDYHAIWVNKKAMEIAGISKNTVSPKGGRIIRDKNGNATGVFIDNAMNLILNKIPKSNKTRIKKAACIAIKKCLSLGVTTFHDAYCRQEEIEVYHDLLQNNELPIRLYAIINATKENLKIFLPKGPKIGIGNHHLTIRAIKLTADGALGSRGAALIEDYSDEPGKKGLLMLSQQEIYELSMLALKHKFQVATHAIGDKTNQVTLDAYEQAFKEHFNGKIEKGKNVRFRIEHAQILAKQDIPRFAKLGIIAVMQATHCTSDMPWVHDRIGKERTKQGAYIWQALLKTGAIVSGGSDTPVESVNPLWGFYAAITRQDHKGNPKKGWYPDQKLTRMQALKTYTMNAAYCGFEEKIKGSLKVGKLADMVVLSRDIMAIPTNEILETKVLLTIIGGKIVYSQE